MNLKQHIESTPKKYGTLLPTVVCKDGTRISVQATKGFHACAFDTDDNQLTHVEVKFASDYTPPAEWDGFCDSPIYAYVPIELVQSLIDKHGGVSVNE